MPIGVLSGGERRRVELARILFAGSDVLCLDEPTNHLDVDAKDWLMGFLRQYRGALLVISHDLELLDEAITRVLHLDRADRDRDRHDRRVQGHVHAVPQRPRRGRAATHQAGRRARSEIARMQKFVDRFGAKATKAAQAHSVEKRIARLAAEKVEAPKATKTITVRFPDPPSCGQTVIEASGCARATAARRCSKTSASTSGAASGCSCSV